MNSVNVSDVSSHRHLQIDNAADALKKSKQLRSVFSAVYAGKKQPKTLEDLKKLTSIDGDVRLLQLIKQLDTLRLIDRQRIKNKTVCFKIPLISLNKQKILAMSQDKKKLAKFRAETRGTSKTIFTTIRVPQKMIRARQLTIDDIDSFEKVRKLKEARTVFTPMPERDFNNGVRKIVGEKWEQLDWGGESDDLYTTKLRIKGKRIPTAFAFKGKATKHGLVPGKMGKNGDQIQRLFSSPAELFVVQHQGLIKKSVVEQMKVFAEVKSIHEGKTIYFMVIDDQDSARLIEAYPSYF